MWVYFLIAIIILLAIVCIIEYRVPFSKNTNPFFHILISKKLRDSYLTLKRVDKRGYLYEINYMANYHDNPPVIIKLLKLFSKAGCSAFSFKNTEEDRCVARNYDFNGYDKDGNRINLNVIVKTGRKGKYKSIGVADLSTVSIPGFRYKQGSLDDGKTNLLLLKLLPYLVVDGINEKGLSCSILAVDNKEGEEIIYQREKGKPKCLINEIVRRLLDNCSSCEECIDYIKSLNYINLLGHNFHLYICDNFGTSIVVEWRHNKISIINSDVVTNFYLCENDGEDFYRNGKVIDKCEKKYPEYNYGYGHGYQRFNTIVTELKKYKKEKENVLGEDEAFAVIMKARQNPIDNISSFSRYSVVYNLNKLSMEIILSNNDDISNKDYQTKII